MLWRSLRFKLVLVYTLLILFAVELIGAYFVRALTSTLIHNQSSAAKSQAQLMATLVAPQLDSNAKGVDTSITALLQSVPQFLDATVYVLNQDGDVTYTTAGGALIGQKRIDSVATQALLHHTSAQSIRFDPLSKSHLLAIAVPIEPRGKFIGILEYVLSIQSTYDTIRQATTIFYTGSIGVLILTIVLGIIVARALTRPVLDVTRQARVMAEGDFSTRLLVTGNDEFSALGEAINHLADELAEALAANRMEQDRLRTIITSIGEGLIVLDANCNVLFMNRAARNIFHATEDPDVDPVELLGLDRLANDALESEARSVRVVGDTIYHVIVTGIYRNGQVEGFVAVVRDVTEQEKLNQARRDFVTNVSHELRTPLTTVKSHLEVLHDLDEDEVETRNQFLKVIEEETDRMVRLTQDLLQLSDLDRGATPNVQQPIAVVDLLDRVRQRFAVQANGLHLEFHVEHPRETATIYGNFDMVNRILDNLISNAFKYTAPGGSVRVTTFVYPTTVSFEVVDSGIGIPESDLPRVFERFYRVDKARSRRLGGTGLGLALAREMAERMGGFIYISSEPDVGTTVRVTFRRADGGDSV
ncbi:ATP-binding protein [Alicyclobacillus acidiphilus]|uniref:ATP-binding protein n=1 Tax=Alicyclobacillus acidiphilus TaxID=182455 RepID=UPI0008346557|nr:ATP-binding protein [Alicyclobacillus acidiphilus]